MSISITNRLLKYADTALEISREVCRSKRHVSLITTKKGSILACGTNQFRTHPLAKQYGYRYDEVHSELDALLKLPKGADRNDLILLNFRFNRFGDMRISKPCCLCLPWCQAVFSDIFYSTDKGVIKL
tara:strand:- start:1252 stop:1635 length:384 start_codon:yes stop_codon:yes gene_type:complete